ncbi:MAG: agmatine deiminase family protein [Muribaculaceae bacterium]|nr:agmatine deiminase family protein [Muribaculaceae bacterium]
MTGRTFIAEWEPQQAVMIAWPHAGTDWASMLGRVQECYRRIASAIAEDEPLIIVTPEPDVVRQQLAHIDNSRLTIVQCDTDDTWTRDYGPLATLTTDGIKLLDFTFNAWGMKFAASHDNLVTNNLAKQGIFPYSIENHRDMVLEGGSIECDGNGTIMTTAECLLSPNRNAAWNKIRIEQELCHRLGARQILWLEHGFVPGDDTDSHIDTIARFAPGGVILHTTAHESSKEYAEMQLMIKQLASFTDADGNPYRLVALPAPPVLTDEDGQRMPATYANFLITNHSVLVPTYGNPETDAEALRIIQGVFTDRKAIGIDCLPLIEQHGSLHCATMQIPRQLHNIK